MPLSELDAQPNLTNTGRCSHLNIFNNGNRMGLNSLCLKSLELFQQEKGIFWWSTLLNHLSFPKCRSSLEAINEVNLVVMERILSKRMITEKRYRLVGEYGTKRTNQAILNLIQLLNIRSLQPGYS
jgi:hypothetical protein